MSRNLELAHIATALSRPWAITAEGLEGLVSLARREGVEVQGLGPRAESHVTGGVSAGPKDDDGDKPPKRGALAEGDDYLRDNGRAIVRSGVAIIPVIGPLIAYPSIMESCGMTSYATLKKDLAAAVSHPTVSAVLLEVDSPGGQVTGCSEAAAAVRAAAEHLPVAAMVVGDACSAALWIVSAADHIAITPTSGVGSLGCCCSVTDRRAAEEKAGVKTHEIISSQTPNKRPDVATDEGRAAIQRIADDTAAVFLAQVAAYRGLSLDVVQSEQFGQGAVFIGQKAVDAGLADEVSTFDEVFAELTGTAGGEDSQGSLLSAV
ncbi:MULTISPECIES: S49 family peptidase [Methylobacterium]|uniref:S49 family peptidase n=1 Tax=Methylobacterium TaxID=407 RepID=UPI00272E7FD8|nr:S49 family peptidase [Methylobacterium sp.]